MKNNENQSKIFISVNAYKPMTSDICGKYTTLVYGVINNIGTDT